MRSRGAQRRFEPLVCVGLAAGLIGLNAHAVFADSPDPIPPAGYVDEALFREQLRQRGLTDWLQQYYADTPVPDEIDARFRRRESLLARAAEPGALTHDRRAKVAEASAILTSLIAEHPEHPSRLRWLFERARDDLERCEPEAFEAVLLYESAGRDRVRVASLSAGAIETLKRMRRQIAQAWETAGSMEEDALEEATASGSLSTLETQDRQSSLLLAWATLYHALSADLEGSRRTAAFSALLEEVTERHAWTEVGAGQETLRCHALVLAAVAARRAGRFDAADAYARQIVATFTKVADPHERKQLRNASLLAVLEQVRVLRDAGKLDEALKAVGQARAWARRARPEDVRAGLAIALVERSILARRSGARVACENLLRPAEALAPIRVFAEQSPNRREAVYAVLAGTLGADTPATPATQPAAESLFELQLIVGATLRTVSTELPPDRRMRDARLEAAIDAVRRVVASPPADAPSPVLGELMFLLGRAYYLKGHRLESVARLADLVEKVPKHDRALMAARQAVAVAEALLRGPGGTDTSNVRTAFVRAARLLRRQDPDSPASRRLQYFIALRLENSGRLREAEEEYAAVPADDANALRAGLRRARCLRKLLDAAVAAGRPAAPAVRELAGEALRVTREAADLGARAGRDEGKEDDRCLAAELVLALASLLNHPSVGQPAGAVDTLSDFERRFADCPGATGRALRGRVLALRQLKRMGDARRVVERFLQTDPEHAGPVMANLLEAMRDEINAAADRGDELSVTSIAKEAARLADTLLAWSRQRAERVGQADRLTLRVWRAWSLLHASKPGEAIDLYETCAQAGADMLSPDAALRFEITLGRAECRLALDEPARAVELFTEVWQRSSEHSRPWWRAFVGSLEAHTRLGHDPNQILQSIRQQRHLAPDLGGPRWRRALEAIERTNLARTAR